jgi:hypothetical protein
MRNNKNKNWSRGIRLAVFVVAVSLFTPVVFPLEDRCPFDTPWVPVDFVDVCKEKYNDTYRPSYCDVEKKIRPDDVYCVNPKVFEDLPPYPRTFDSVFLSWERERIRSGFSSTLDDSAFYEQPEWYLDRIWQRSHWKTYIDPGWAMSTIGVLASVRDVTIVTLTQRDIPTKGTYLEVDSYIQQNPGVPFFAGTKLVPRFHSREQFKTGRLSKKSIEQDPEMASKYIHFVNMTPSENLLFSPTFPKFRKGWKKKVVFTVLVDQNIPPGTYVLSFDTDGPSGRQTEEWLREIDRMGFPMTSYYPLTGHKGLHRLVVEVEGRDSYLSKVGRAVGVPRGYFSIVMLVFLSASGIGLCYGAKRRVSRWKREREVCE